MQGSRQFRNAYEKQLEALGYELYHKQRKTKPDGCLIIAIAAILATIFTRLHISVLLHAHQRDTGQILSETSARLVPSNVLVAMDPQT